MNEAPRSVGLRRDVELLTTLADEEAAAGRGLAVGRLAELTGRQQSQVSRAMAALADEGLVEREPGTRSYTLGSRLYALAARSADTRLVRHAAPLLQALAAGLGASAQLCRLHETRVVTMLDARPGQGPASVCWELSGEPAPRTPAGRALLADHSPHEIAGILGQVAAGPGLDAVLCDTRRATQGGYVLADGTESPQDLAGAAAPVRDFRGAVVAAISVVGPARQLRGRLTAAGTATARAATELSQQLGPPAEHGTTPPS